MKTATTTCSNLVAMSDRFDGALCPEDVFGVLAGNIEEKRIGLKLQYRNLVRACHPDLVSPADSELAARTFQALVRWEIAARQKVEGGTYGDRKPWREPVPPYTPTTLTVRGKALKLTGLIAEGVFATVHAAEFETETLGAAFAKCARDPADNDLLEREYRVLSVLQKPDSDPRNERDFFSKQRAYVPTPLTSFSLRDVDRIRHQVNVLSVPLGRSYTVAELRTEKFPDGIEPKHVWWIFRRLLLTAWMAHLRGFIHGGITPDHVLVYPEAHGLVLLDWTCAAAIGDEYVPAINPAWEAICAPETLRKEMARPSTDIFMAAATALYMLGGDPKNRQIPACVPTSIARLLLDCLNPDARKRPQDAERLHAEFGALLGKRVYAEMVIP